MRTLISFLFIFYSTISFSQSSILKVEGKAPAMYVSHIVAAKESLYSLARQYNLPPATLAAFNGSTLQTGLQIGQAFKIPLIDQNFYAQGQKPADESLVPVYHTVDKGETLFRLATNYNAPLQGIRQWNSLNGDNISVGTDVVIGYLRVKNEQLASLPFKTASAVKTVATPAPASEATAVAPAQVPDGTVAKTSAIPANELPEAVKAAKQTAPAATAPSSAIVAQSVVAKPAITNVTATVNSQVPTQPQQQSAAAAGYGRKLPDLLAEPPKRVTDEGFFINGYDAESAERKQEMILGDAATFKSTSGWQNKKYYALINNVLPGTIVKVTSGDRSIYARVLGAMPEMKENNNVLIRLSNAAASYLGKIDPKFAVQVSYYQ